MEYRELIDGVTITVTGEGDTPEKKANSLKHNKSLIAEVEVKGKRYMVGELKIWPNAPENQKTAHVTLVMVHTQTINENLFKQEKENAKAYFKKYLPQALVQVEVKEDFLDLSNDTSFREQYLTDGFIKAYYEDEKENKEYRDVALVLKDKYNKEASFYKESYVAFYFYQNRGIKIEERENDEDEREESERIKNIGGYDSLEDALVLFPLSDKDDTNPTHELCHMIGISHSFANKESNKGKLKNEDTFICGQTDNIMDYFSLRFSLWKWQWKFIQENVK